MHRKLQFLGICRRNEYGSTCTVILNPSYKRCTNIMSSVMVRKENKGHYSPSTNDVRSVTLAAFLRPAGRLSPILSNLSRNDRPPFLDFAL